MKQQILDKLYYIISSSTSIKLHIDKVEELRNELEVLEDFTDIDRMELNAAIKSKVQDEAELAIRANKGWGCVFMATGTGKSKIVINRTFADGKRRLIVVPTIKLRDETWRAEFAKWSKLDTLFSTKLICYDSLHTIIGKDIDEVYLDEGHNLTENHLSFFKDNNIKSCIVLTATKPEAQNKINIFNMLNLYPIYEISLDEAVKLGLVAPYDITIITTKLDDTDKYLKAGPKAKPWMQTEQAAYNYISRIIDEERARKLDKIIRMHLIYSCRSKMKAAKWILDNVIPQEARTLIFAGSIEHAIALCPNRYHSKVYAKKTDTDERKAQVARIMETYKGSEDLKKFETLQLNRLSCVFSLNEGENIRDLDYGFQVQLNSVRLQFIQRTGRIVRFRPGHLAKIIVLVLENTIDHNWAKKAMVGLNAIRIRTISLEDLQSGKETISYT